MKKLNRLVVLVLIASLISTFMTGCSIDEMRVLNAMVKSSSIRSMESKSNFVFKFDADGFSDGESEVFQTISPILNDMKISVDQKVNQNEDKSIIKSQMDVSFEVGGVSSKVGIWIDSNTNGEKPVIKEIVKVPAIATVAFPSPFKGKQYIELDMADVPGVDKEFTTEYKRLVEVDKNFVFKFSELIKEYATKFDPGYEFIKYKCGSSVNGEFLTFYELKLDDSSFKTFIKSALTNLVQNQKTLELIRELLITSSKLSMASNPTAEKYDVQMDEMLGSIKLGIPQSLKAIDEFFEAFGNVKILGEKGITITYGINNDGYIASETGILDFSIDMKTLEPAVQRLMNIPAMDSMKVSSGVINFGIDYNKEISNINKNVQITFPELTKKNSFSYKELNDVLNPIITDNYGYVPNGYNNEPISVVVNNKELGPKFKAEVQDGVIMVPLRAVSEALGAKVVSDVKSQTVTVLKDDMKLVFKTDSKEMLVNGQKVTLYNPMTSIENKNYVPVYSITNYLGARLQWNRKTNALIITSGYNNVYEADLLVP